MNYRQLEAMCNRAFRLCFVQSKLLGVFPVIFLCMLIVASSKAFAAEANAWGALSLVFASFIACVSLLLLLGIVLSRIYYNEVQHMHLSYRKLLEEARSLLSGALFLAIPLLGSYLALWLVFGIVSLLHVIPAFGAFFAVVFAFASFLLVFAAFLLAVGSVFLLYFAVPHLAFKYGARRKLAEALIRRMRENPFSNTLLFLLALTPLALMIALLSVSLSVTEAVFLHQMPLVSVLQWFFILVPFSALLTPAVIFFFNFAVESYVFFAKRRGAIEMTA